MLYHAMHSVRKDATSNSRQSGRNVGSSADEHQAKMSVSNLWNRMIYSPPRRYGLRNTQYGIHNINGLPEASPRRLFLICLPVKNAAYSLRVMRQRSCGYYQTKRSPEAVQNLLHLHL